MRPFPSAPRARRARLLTTLVAVATTLVLGAGGATYALVGAEDLKDKQKKVEKQIDHAHDELEHSSRQAQRAAAALEDARDKLAVARERLAEAESKLSVAQARDAEMQTRLAEAEAQLAQAQADVVAGQQAVASQRAEVVDTVTDIYAEGDPRMRGLATILDARGLEDLMRRMQLEDAVVARQKTTYDELRATEVLLRVREEQVEAAKEQVAAQRAAAAEHLKVVEGLHQQAVAARSEVLGLVASAKDARQDARAARAHDKAVLAKLRKREAEIRKKILAAARRAARKSDGGYVGASNGFFDWPAAGRVTSPFGFRVHPIYRYWGLHNGTDFGADCGTPLRAVADGTVMSTYSDSVYGKRLYLNVGRVNGAFLTAVYNHATRYVVGKGAHVSRGQVIGYVGSTGWSTGCHLHFTVLANGDPVNPMNYL